MNLETLSFGFSLGRQIKRASSNKKLFSSDDFPHTKPARKDHSEYSLLKRI